MTHIALNVFSSTVVQRTGKRGTLLLGMSTSGSDHILDGCSPAVEMFANVQPIWSPGSSAGAIEDNQSATQIDKISQESSTSISKDEWFISVENYVEDTTDKLQIQRIPSFLRDKPSNKTCYDPLVISIGPYHHGKPQLDAFEKLKIPVAQKFVRACGNHVSIKQLYEEVAKVGESVRKCYEKGTTDEYEDESFTKMMLLDACFVLEFMSFSETESNYSSGTVMERNEVDPLQPWSRYLAFARSDLFLLENQIPLLVLKVLMKFRFKNESEGTKLIQNFLEQTVTIMPPQKSTYTNAVKKFVQRMMRCSVQKREKWKMDMDMDARPHHLLHLVREQLIGPSPEDENEKKSVKRLLHLIQEQLTRSFSEDKNKEKFIKWHSYRSVMELKSAGIHFRPSQTNHVTDVKFKSHLISGTLKLPPIMVDYSTKSLLLNLAAYEMSPHGPSDYRLMSYICLMDSFIDHADDVKELRKRRILVNNLGSDKELAQLFNEIANDLVPDLRVYEDVQRQIENHCRSKAQVWTAEWIDDHFNSPWALLAFLGAFFTIALTVAQTYIDGLLAINLSGNK
ncbi:putative UPF0481 protein At3g02645 isoform X2 [Olea europaea var. sylvestris]|uniref:putative UPF0481 protein At3g02645 isoform X2 n=1 Tax=Olea europaea var. sylvestris TaxID=158386 RepID=UPI000C1D470A|nr:putative UPF0481 protein At3g02645 isoform X2 [Olea europaea var. sylvestris]